MPKLIPSQSHFTSKMAFSLSLGDQMTSCDLTWKRPQRLLFPLSSIWTSQMGEILAQPYLTPCSAEPHLLGEMDLKK